MKPVVYTLPAILCLLIGIGIGYRSSGGLKTPSPTAEKRALPEPPLVTQDHLSVPDRDSPTKVSPTSIEHLQALELMRHEVPGKALVDHLPRLFESSYEVSGALSALMELSGEEEDQLNEFVSFSIDELGKLESKHAIQHTNADGSKTVNIPALPQEGTTAIRESFLSQVESNLGSKKRAILEMHFLNNSGLLGGFGSEAISLSLPSFEETHKREDLITLKVERTVPSDSGGPQKTFEERAFFISNFKKRFGHLFDLKVEKDQE